MERTSSMEELDRLIKRVDEIYRALGVHEAKSTVDDGAVILYQSAASVKAQSRKPKKKEKKS